MPEITKQSTKPELHRQPRQVPSPPMETQQPKSQKRLWLLTGILVLVLIVMVVASQAGKSSPSPKTTTQATQLQGAQAASWHDTDYTLTIDPAASWHDTDHSLTIDPAASWHDTDHTLTVDPAP